jgi:integrase
MIKGAAKSEIGPIQHHLAWRTKLIAPRFPSHAAGIAGDRKGPLFRTAPRTNADLTRNAMSTADVWRMIRRRLKQTAIKTLAGCHSFRATGITCYLENKGTLEKAQQMASHSSPRTTKLYDRTNDQVTLDEVEKIII